MVAMKMSLEKQKKLRARELMFEVAIIKDERGGSKSSSKIKKFDDYNKARKFVEDFNKEDKSVPQFCEYATVIVNF